jgi:hypothetical protein
MAFGPKIVGAENYKKTTAAKRGRSGFGPRVTGKQAPTAEPKRRETGAVDSPRALVSPEAGAVEDSLSIEQVQEILAQNPAFIETIHVQELERAEGPRREALLAIRASAVAQSLDDIVSEVDELMKDSGMAPAVTAPAPTPTGVVIPKDFNKLKALAKTFDIDTATVRTKVDITAAIVTAATLRGLTVTAEE